MWSYCTSSICQTNNTSLPTGETRAVSCGSHITNLIKGARSELDRRKMRPIDDEESVLRVMKVKMGATVCAAPSPGLTQH